MAAETEYRPLDQAVRGTITVFACGYCFAQAGYDIVSAEVSEATWPWGDLEHGNAFALVTCRSCGMINLLAFGLEEDRAHGTTTGVLLSLHLDEHPEIIRYVWIPAGTDVFGHEEGRVYTTSIALLGQYPYGHRLADNIDEVLRGDLQEAGNCLAVGAGSACAVMCRRVVERLAGSLGVEPQATLHLTLQKLQQEGRIDDTLHAAPSEIKAWGNVGAHPDADSPGWTAAEARDLLALVIHAVEYAYSGDRLGAHTSKLADRRNR